MSQGICARCKCNISDNETSGESGLYSPSKQYILCESCFFAEEYEIEDAGTNVIPERIEQYERDN